MKYTSGVRTGAVAGVTGLKTKDCPSCILSYVSSRNRWLSSISQRKTPSLGATGPHVPAPSPGGAGPGEAPAVQPSSSLGSCPDAIGAAVRPSRLQKSTPGALSASIVFPPLGSEQAFFQTIQSLSWLFLGCAGASPYQPLSWVFQGCLPFS